MGGSAQLEIRPARPDDLDAVAELYWRSWHESQARLEPPEIAAMRPLGFFENRVTGWPEPPLAAWRNGQLAGFAAWQGDYLGQVFVDPALRGAGIGAHLLSAAETKMARAGIGVAKLDCIVGNVGARQFYERWGWHVTDEIDDPMPVEGQSTNLRIWQMVKDLDPA